jgi:hypothetical protein
VKLLYCNHVSRHRPKKRRQKKAKEDKKKDEKTKGDKKRQEIFHIFSGLENTHIFQGFKDREN